MTDKRWLVDFTDQGKIPTSFEHGIWLLGCKSPNEIYEESRNALLDFIAELIGVNNKAYEIISGKDDFDSLYPEDSALIMDCLVGGG